MLGIFEVWSLNENSSVGLDVEISTFRGDGQLQQALAAGSVDFGFGSGPGMGYASKGVPAHAVAAVANRPANPRSLEYSSAGCLDSLSPRERGRGEGERRMRISQLYPLRKSARKL